MKEESPLTITELEQKIIDFAKKYHGVSCAEISNKFGKGNTSLTMKQHIITAFGLSEEVGKALDSLIKKRELVEIPCNILIYLIDGQVLTIPIAKNIPNNGYKKDHWLPCYYYTYDHAIEYIKSKYKDKPKDRDEILNNLRK